MEKVGAYIKAYIKGKTPKELVSLNTGDLKPYISPDYLRNVAPPEFYCKELGNGIEIDDGEVLILWDGSNAGEVFISKEGILASTMTMLKFDSKEFEKKYFAYSFKNLEYTLKGKTAGSGIPHADKGVIKRLEVFKPSLPEQQAIAGIISKVDQCIENVQKSIEATQKLKKSLMQNLLTGRMKPDGTMRKETDFWEHPKMGKVPNGWEVFRLKDIALNKGDYGSNSSAIPYSINSARFIRITDISDDGLLFEDDAVSSTDTTEKYLLHEDDFLFARTGDTVGKSLLYKEIMGKSIFAGYLIRFVLNKEKIVPEYFDLITKSDFFEAFKVSMKRVGVKPNINSREYCSFKFLLPTNLDEQKDVLKIFNSVILRRNEANNKMHYLHRLKKSLMQNLLTGQKRVDVVKINSLLESMN